MYAVTGLSAIGAAFVAVALVLAVIVLYALAGWDPMIRLFFWLGTTGAFGVLCLRAGFRPSTASGQPSAWAEPSLPAGDGVGTLVLL
jgi:hypothetical protein